MIDYNDREEVKFWNDILTIVEIDGKYTFKGVLNAYRFLPEEKKRIMPMFTKKEAEEIRDAALDPGIMNID